MVAVLFFVVLFVAVQAGYMVDARRVNKLLDPK